MGRGEVREDGGDGDDGGAWAVLLRGFFGRVEEGGEEDGEEVEVRGYIRGESVCKLRGGEGGNSGGGYGRGYAIDDDGRVGIELRSPSQLPSLQ